jgi:hypothetical protein
MPHLEKSNFRPPVPFRQEGPGGNGLPQSEHDLVDMVLQLNRIVQPAEPGELIQQSRPCFFGCLLVLGYIFPGYGLFFLHS